MKKIALVSGIVLAAATAALVLGLRASGKADVPGFFGLGTLQADVNLTLELLLVAGLTVGMALARRGHIEAHRINQTTWVMVNAVLVALIMVGSIRAFKLAHFSDLANPGNFIIAAHALFGTLTFAAGAWLVLQMNDILPERLHIRNWKALMRADACRLLDRRHPRHRDVSCVVFRMIA